MQLERGLVVGRTAKKIELKVYNTEQPSISAVYKPNQLVSVFGDPVYYERIKNLPNMKFN